MRPERYVQKKIADVKSSDSKVSFVCKVMNSQDSTLIVEDETGQKEIFSEHDAEKGSLVRVFCTSVDGRLKADAVQSLNGLDLNLYQKVQELYRKVGI